MREKIILAPGAKGPELTKSLAMHGINCINLRICGAGELARMALMRSGVPIPEDFVSIREETTLIAEAAKGEAYFEKATYSDLQELAGAIRRMRSLAADNEAGTVESALNKGIFTDKNSALISVYKKYMQLLSDGKLTDHVSLIRKAITDCAPIDADFNTLKEYPLTPLERSLLNKLSGGSFTETDLPSLFGADASSPSPNASSPSDDPSRAGTSKLSINSFKNCYGAPNEVETILTDIYSSDKNLDKCTVAVTDTGTYAQLFFDYALLYDMPISFGCGIPIINSNPAKLLVLYYQWMTGGFFGPMALNAILSSKAFDRAKLDELYPEPDENFSWRTYYDALSGLKLTNDPAINSKRIADFKQAVDEEESLADPDDEKACKKVLKKKLCIPYLEILSKELSMPPEDFIYKYAYIRKGSETNARLLLMQLDMASLQAIYEELKVMRASGIEQATEDMILNVLKLGVAGGRSEEGKLYVTGIDGALSSVRENLYIAGLSASKYPGSPRENYLLLDEDIKLFGPEAEYLTSDERIGMKRERLMTLARLAAGLGSTINVSYAGLNVSELKRDNASSLVYELFREAYGTGATSKELEEHIEKVDYFAPAISVTRKVGEAYNEGKTVLPKPPADIPDTPELTWNLDKEYSPSALETFFNCPRAFMLQNILGIEQPDEDKPFEVIAANETGTMAHSLMEELANSNMTLDEFLKLSGEYFDRFIMQHPPLVTQEAEPEREAFLDMMETAYNQDPHREVAMTEEKIHGALDCGVKISGILDRLEKNDDGSYLVVDFKSGRSIIHVQDDIDTCMQIVMYAYILEQMGYKISGGEYRYIRQNEIVTCRYDDDMKKALDEKLAIFKEYMEESYFPVSEYALNGTGDTSDPCKYCKYGLICGKTTEAEEGGSEDE